MRVFHNDESIFIARLEALQGKTEYSLNST